jgi:hypothetical protein
MPDHVRNDVQLYDKEVDNMSQTVSLAYPGFFGGVMPGIFSRGGVKQIQLRTEGRKNGDLGVVAP